jgi:hypothetical protein
MSFIVVRGAPLVSVPTISVTPSGVDKLVVALAAPSTVVPATGILGYNLQQSLSAGGPFADIATLVAPGSFPYTVSGLVSGTTYYYRAEGVDAGPNRDSSDWSAIVNATVGSTPPVGSAIAYPRIGAYPIGGSPRAYDDDAFILWASKHNGPMLMGVWDGWQNGDSAQRTKSFAQVCSLMISTSSNADPPIPIQYTNSLTKNLTAGGEVPARVTIINNNNFMVKTSYPNGSNIPASYWNASYSVGNIAPSANEPTYQGRNWRQYSVDYYYDFGKAGGSLGLAFNTGGLFAANPSLKGMFVDDFYLAIPNLSTAGDWLRTGTAQAAPNSTVDAAIRQGQASLAAYWKARSPGDYTLANISQVRSASTNTSGTDGVFHGGVCEGLMGFSWSQEVFDSWLGMMNRYAAEINFCIAPKLAIFGHGNVTYDGRDYYYPTTPYQAAKYGFCSCHLHDGFYYPNSIGNGSVSNANAGYNCNLRNWFDYYAVHPVTGVAQAYPNVALGYGYLGTPIDSYYITGTTVAWQSGVFRRRFFNNTTGKEWWVLVNPKGNGTQTINLGTTMNKITSISQDTTIDNGSSVTSVTMSAASGLILFK